MKMKNTLLTLMALIIISCRTSEVDKALEVAKPKIEDEIKYQVAKWKTYKSDVSEIKGINYNENPDALTFKEYEAYFTSVTRQINDWYKNSKEIEKDFTQSGHFYKYSDVFPFITNWAKSIKESEYRWIEAEIVEKIISEYSTSLKLSNYEFLEDFGGDVVRYKVSEPVTELEFIVQLNKTRDGYCESIRLVEESLDNFIKSP